LFGKQSNSTGSLVNPFRYTARESDRKQGCITIEPDTTIPTSCGF
jgi:hypothetical protein